MRDWLDVNAPAPRPVKAYLVWGAGMFAYIVAVLQRSSFGVAGLDAAHRFDAGASLVASCAMLQLVVYAGLQIPVGAMLDRLGPRFLIATGAFVMAIGQFTLALAGTLPLAITGRALVGAGDAMTFISVLRLVSLWFPPRRVPLLTQVSGLSGQLGQLLSVVPLLAVLHTAGWVPAFLSLAAIGVVAGVVVIAVVAEPPGAAHGDTQLWRIVRDLRIAWSHPGTRLGLWTHFSTQFPGTVFTLMWGYPFLVSGEGVSPHTASFLLTVMVVIGVVTGPFLGVMVERHPLKRSWLVLGVIGVNAAAWTAVLAWPGPAPVWLLVVLAAALATGGAGSMIGFDFARTFNPPNRQGTATGIVNVGGFVASLLTIILIGVVLDLRSADGATNGDYDLAAFRVAMCVHYVFWVVGVAGILNSRRRVRRRISLRQVRSGAGDPGRPRPGPGPGPGRGRGRGPRRGRGRGPDRGWTATGGGPTRGPGASRRPE